MSYKVLNDFMEKYHNNTVYRKGDTYPQEGFKADSKRVEFLQEAHSTYGVPFLEKTVVPKQGIPVEKSKKPIARRTAKSGEK